MLNEKSDSEPEMSNLSANNQAGKLYVVSAPSGAGKTSLVRTLLESESSMEVAISHTTRPRRPEEQDGVNYHFVDKQGFQAMVEDGGFVEWATVFGNLYGTSVQAVSRALDAGRNLILEIDWQGAAQVRQKFPDTESIFIFPPSLAALRERLEARAQDDETTVTRRMDEAFQELSHWKEFDYLIINDNFETALEELSLVVQGRGEAYRREHRQEELALLIADLLP